MSTSRMLAVVGALALTIAGCSGGSDDPVATPETPSDQSSAPTGAEPDATTSSTIATENNSAQQGSSSDAPEGDIVLEGGSATFTMDGETVEFDYFVCVFDSESTGLTDFSFRAAGGGHNGNGDPVAVVVDVHAETQLDQSVVFGRTDESGTFDDSAWKFSTTQDPAELQPGEFEIDGDQVTVNGTFVQGRAGDGPTSEGSLNATCSPNSVGK